MGQDVLLDLFGVASAAFRQNLIEDAIKLVFVQFFQKRGQSRQVRFSTHLPLFLGMILVESAPADSDS